MSKKKGCPTGSKKVKGNCTFTGRRFAYWPVIYGKGYCVGRADEGVRGYTPQLPRFKEYKDAEVHADKLNKSLGISKKDIFEIVGSTMRRR